MSELEVFDESMYDDEAAALEALKATATQLGLQFHPSIGYDKLYDKVKAFRNSEGVASAPIAPDAGLVPETEKELHTRIRKSMRKLVRVEVQCLDPLKKEWSGEVLTVSNDAFTIRRMVPFNTPWHIEEALLHMMEEKEYQYFVEKRLANGFKTKEARSGKTYSIKRLDPLTEKELGLLAIKQAQQGE